MAEPSDSSPKKEEAKSIPLNDFVTFKKASIERERKLRAQLEDANRQKGSLEAELKVTRANVVDDDEAKSVRAFLMAEKDKIDAKEKKYEEDVTAFRERERQVKVKELAGQYGIDASDLEGEEDIDSVALRLYADKLTEENKKLKETSPTQTQYETGPVTVLKKQPKDMTNEEFAQHTREIKEKALSK